MDIKLNEDQVEISRQARRFLEKESAPDFVRAMYEDRRGFSDQFWTGQVEMGWTALRLPERFGGLEMELFDMCLILEEMGRVVAPGPFFSGFLAGEMLLASGNEALMELHLPALAEGSKRGAVALYEPDGGPDPDFVSLKAETNGHEARLTGTKIYVPDAHTADFLVVSALIEDEVGLFLVDSGSSGLSVELTPTMDGSRKYSVVEFDQTPGVLLTEPGRGREALTEALARGQVGLAAECLGCAQKALEIAVEYAKVRVQFEQPIGAYQAVKHQAARMYQDVESARTLVYWAAWAQDYDPSQAVLAASSAKAFASEACRRAASGAVQILGGVGFTWEHDIHLYLKRAKANETALGDPVYHYERTAAIVAG